MRKKGKMSGEYLETVGKVKNNNTNNKNNKPGSRFRLRCSFGTYQSKPGFPGRHLLTQVPLAI